MKWIKKIKPVFIIFILLMAGLVISGNGRTALAQLSINEFMADNSNTIKDPDDPNSYEDWIEIYNFGPTVVNMSGMYLTDDPNNPTKWQIPTGVAIPAKGYLLFWADDDEDEGPTHTNFKLGLEGEEINLFRPDGVTLLDSITFGPQLKNISYGRYPNGAAAWGFMAGTPGKTNSVHNAPPAITDTIHTPALPAESNPVWVTCRVYDDRAGISVKLTRSTGSTSVSMTMYDDGQHNDGSSGDGLFGVQIPALAKNTIVGYYITATDDYGVESVDPVKAPTTPYYYIVGYLPPQLFINEFMADNSSTIKDPDDPNSYEDWIEIYNAGASVVNMSGMYLTDNPRNPNKWQIPAGVIIPAKGYLLFWADSDAEEGTLHTNFKLDLEGDEKIGLFDTEAKKNMLIDLMPFEEQLTNFSCGRISNGTIPWVISKDTTPGYSNNFPLGTHPFIWTPPLTLDSYALVTEIVDSLSSVTRFTAGAGKGESAYLFWGKPSGHSFSLESGQNYNLSLTSPCSFSF